MDIDKPAVFLSRIPILVVLVALCVAVLSIAPYWRAWSQAPAGWEFTGNVSVSPDMMQYRAWMRQAQEEGILIDNRFTTEPNRPHLPVIFYYSMGKLAQWMDITPEFVLAYTGALLAFTLSLLLFFVVRHFTPSLYEAWWIFLVIIFGGGLGAHLKIVSNISLLSNNFLIRRTLVEGLLAHPVLEDYRWPYFIISLFESHALLLWLIVSVAVLSLYFTLQKFSWWRLSLTVILYALATFLHIYQGITLLVITAAVIFVFWRKGEEIRSGLITLGVSAIFVAICIGWQVLMYSSSGLPLPSWRAQSIQFSTLLIGYPLAWGLIIWGFTDYWRSAGIKECFLLGWALGCTALTLSGPFYPYPDRGLLTLQIPLYIIAGSIFFSKFKGFKPAAVLVAVLILAATPAWIMKVWWDQTGFDADKPYMFMDAEHREIVNLLGEQASENDVLILDKSEDPWKTDDLWLVPEYPGKMYCGHFFLTPDYERKCGELVHFFNDSSSEEQAVFLESQDIRFVYVDAGNDPQRFERVPGLVLLKSLSIGSLYEYIG